MFSRPAHHRLIVQLADILAILLSLAAAYYLWLAIRRAWPSVFAGSEIILDSALIIVLILSAVLWVAIFNIYGAYSYQRFTSFHSEIKFIFKTVLLGTLIFLSLVFLVRPGYMPRTVIALFAPISFVLLTFEKSLLFLVARIIRRRGHNRKTVLVVGTGGQTRRFIDAVRRHFSWGLDIIGFLDPSPENVGREICGKKILGAFSDIVPVLHAYGFEEVIITVSTNRMEEIRSILEACEREGVQVRIVSDFWGKITKQIRADVVYGLPILSISYIHENQAALALKRVIDVAVSSLTLLVLFPVMLTVAAAIKLTSPGPVFYGLTVVGFNRKSFKTRKFRTMVVGAEQMKAELMHLNEIEGPVFKIKQDPRVTPLGRFLRKYSIDELPQLWSVLKGDLSLVGPRAPGSHEVERFESWQRRKLSIKPGLTCIWQVNGRSEIKKFDDWVKMDLDYIDNWSLGLDLKILLKTIPVVISGRGAN